MIGLTNDGVSQKGKLIKHDGAILDDGKRRRSKRSVKKSRRSRKSRRSVKKSRRSVKKSRRSRKSKRSAKKSRRSRKSRRSARKSRRSKKHDGMSKEAAIKEAKSFATKHKISKEFMGVLVAVLVAGYGINKLWKNYSDPAQNNFGDDEPTPLGFIDYLARLPIKGLRGLIKQTLTRIGSLLNFDNIMFG